MYLRVKKNINLRKLILDQVHAMSNNQNTRQFINKQVNPEKKKDNQVIQCMQRTTLEKKDSSKDNKPVEKIITIEGDWKTKP